MTLLSHSPKIYHTNIFARGIYTYPLEYACTALIVGPGLLFITLHTMTPINAVIQIEREMGSGGFIITYFSAGIFGFVQSTLLHVYWCPKTCHG